MLFEVLDERMRQIDVHDRHAAHDDRHAAADWAWLISKRAVDLSHPWDDAHVDRRRELIEIAAIAVAAIESHDRKAADTDE